MLLSPPFLRLPPELRNIIYADALSGIEIQVTESSDRSAAPQCLSRDIGSSGMFSRAHFMRQVALTRTCRQIYEETRLLPFMNSPQVWHNRRVFVKWFVSLKQPVRDAVWAGLDDVLKVAVMSKTEYMNMLAVERYNDLVGATEVWGKTRVFEMFDY